MEKAGVVRYVAERVDIGLAVGRIEENVQKRQRSKAEAYNPEMQRHRTRLLKQDEARGTRNVGLRAQHGTQFAIDVAGEASEPCTDQSRKHARNLLSSMFLEAIEDELVVDNPVARVRVKNVG